MWLCVLYFVLPLIWLIVASTKDTGDLFSTFGLWFGERFSLFDNVVDCLHRSRRCVSALDVEHGPVRRRQCDRCDAARDDGRLRLREVPLPRIPAAVQHTLGAIMIPLTALAIPTYLLFAVGLVNTPWAMIIPSLVSPFGVYLMRVYAQTPSPTHSSRRLGSTARVSSGSSGRWACRLLGPGMVTVLLFTLVATWNNYFLP